MSGGKGGGGKGGGGKGRNIQYVAQPVPKFLQQFKQQTGYKEGPTIQDKFAEGDASCVDSDPERSDDEGPVVVVLKPGDLTKEEAEKIIGTKRKIGESDSDDEPGGKIKFRQPKKKKQEKSADGEGGDSEKKTDNTDDGDRKSGEKKRKKKRPADGPKNRSLLSFEEDEA